MRFLGSAAGHVSQTIYASPTESQTVEFFLTQVVEVINPVTGRAWLDRNLGASRVAISSTDEEAYGDLYQWGRGTDGHEKRNSPIISTLSSSDTPDHSFFITAVNVNGIDWRSTQNDNLWQGVDGINNPCPEGFRIPTAAEWEAERIIWTTINSDGAFSSPLKLPAAGLRFDRNGLLYFLGSSGYYWSNTAHFDRMLFQLITNTSADVNAYYRVYGLSVRCIED